MLASPKMASGTDLMVGAPFEVSEAQLEVLDLRVRRTKDDRARHRDAPLFFATAGMPGWRMEYIVRRGWMGRKGPSPLIEETE